MIIKGYLFSLIYGLLCIGVSTLVHQLGVQTKYTRKITHILVGFEWVILQHYFSSSIHFVIVCLVFTAIVLIIKILKLAPSLYSNGENSNGTVYYCLAMTTMSIITCIFPQMMIPFGIGVFCTSMGDGFAGVFGNITKYNTNVYGKKSILGSLACLIFCFVSIIILRAVYEINISIACAFLIALFATMLELFAKNGIDNVTVTLGTSFLSYFLINFTTHTLHYIVPIIFTLPIVVFVREKKALTTRGILTALALDILSSMAFGNLGFIILVAFFGGSLIADKIKNNSENRREERTAIQVLANGSLGMFFSLAQLIFPSEIWIVAYASVFAEALADTVASGVGSRSSNVYDIFKIKKVDPGISGGMSAMGTVSALVASTIMATIALISPDVGKFEFFVILIAGFLGSVFDSLLGSFIQGKFKCLVCGKMTEEKIHCSMVTEKISGFAWINNSAVNLFSTIFSALVAILFTVVV